MRVLAFGTYDTRSHPRVAVLIEGLREHGHQVVEVNRPLGVDSAARIKYLRQPWRLPRLAWRLALCWAWLVWHGRRASRRHLPDAVLVGYLGHFDVHLARHLYPRTPIVLDHMASAAGIVRDRGLARANGIRGRLVSWLDAAAVAASDLIVVDTEPHRQALPQPAQKRVVVCPVGATNEWFDADSLVMSSPDQPLRVVFAGLFTPLHGAPTIGRAIAELGDSTQVQFTMVGDGQERKLTESVVGSAARVTWLNWVPGDELPALVGTHDVCLGIFGATTKALAVVPTKVYQGAAAGCAIVTSDTPAQRSALGSAARFVPPNDPAALAQAIRELAGDRAELERLRTAARANAPHFAPRSATRPLSAALQRLGEPDPRRDATTHCEPPRPGGQHGRMPPLAPRAWLRYDVVRRALDHLAPSSALEIGCGLGAVGARLARLSEYVGVEPDKQSFAVASARISPLGGTVIHGTHADVPPGLTFDLVCAFEVLEHIEDDRQALAEWGRLVEPGGHLLLSVPAFHERFGPMDRHAGHFRRYSPEGLTDLLQSSGLVDVEVTVYGWPLGFALELVRNRVAARRLEQFQERSMPELTGASGRILQPRSALVGVAVAAAVTPFRFLQRIRTDAGTGLVAVARKPV